MTAYTTPYLALPSSNAYANGDTLTLGDGSVLVYNEVLGWTGGNVIAKTDPVTGGGVGWGVSLLAGAKVITGTPVMTFAELQSALTSGFVGTAFVSDISGGSMWVSDGSAVRPLGGRVTLRATGGVALGTSNARSVGLALALPAKLLRNGDVIEVTLDMSKSAAVDGCTAQVAIGASPSVGGTQLGNANLSMVAANRRIAGKFRFRRVSSTTVALLNGPNGQDGISSGTDIGAVTATVSNMDLMTTYLQITNAMTIGGADVITIENLCVDLVSHD